MDYVLVKCEHCGKYTHMIVDMDYRNATATERENWNKAARVD